MDEKTLKRISIIGVCICLVLLYIVTIQPSSLHVNIGEIDRSLTGKIVNVTGVIEAVSESKGNVFIDLKDDTGEIKVVLWEETIDSIDTNDLNKGELVRGNVLNVIGEVQIYKGELEVVPMRGNVKMIKTS